MTRRLYIRLAMAEVTAAKVEANGFDIFYERKGTGDHVVLFLPGALGELRNDVSCCI